MTPENRVAFLQLSGAAFAGLRVLDLSDSVAGQYCSRLLADFGADVTLVEPPEGSPVRRALPIDPNDPSSSLLFFHLNMGKKSVVLEDDRRGLEPLITLADVVVVGPQTAHVWMEELNPRCIVALVSPFGVDGPYRSWKGSEMIYQALSGMMFHNGDTGREPLYGCGQRASYAAGVAAYISVITALLERERSGQGQSVAVDIVETGAGMCYPAVTQFLTNGSIEQRGDRRQPLGYVQCSDGWVAFWIHLHRWDAACHAIDAPELLSDPRFSQAADRQDNWAALVAEIQARVADWQADALVRRWQAARMVTARAYDLPSLIADCEHLKVRGYWESVDTEGGARIIPGPPFRMSKTPRVVRKGPPKLDVALPNREAARV
jgi:crotonobetainyl-CoA:carnitine CoA-transferase CaiB-like acyl-CoA transferase